MRIDALRLKIFSRSTYQKYILYEHTGVCCRCDVTVIYDVTAS